ncbi:hypothetical protein Q9L58_007156 [Maublancomyces gigas]|uniref:Enoyl reductase (ER) domain-containing protein n=1 Tax=Discina gigas TaxID=1032678 RepID=A0ABR3GDD4_9PEZI
MTSQENICFVLKAKNEVCFENRPVPAIENATDVLVRIHVTGISSSDVHYWEHGHIGDSILTAPMILGHGSSGTVVAVGPECHHLVPGDRVVLEPGVPCRFCSFCKAGKYNLCKEIRFAATPPYDGTLANYYVLPEDFCVLLPRCVSFEEGALIEPLAVGVHVCHQAGIKPGNSVVVFGAGPIGLLCAAVARSFGAIQIVMVDIFESRLEFAATYAATGVFSAAHPGTPWGDAMEIIKRFGLGYGADIAIDTSGALQSAKTAIHVLRSDGTYVQVGMEADETSFPMTAFRAREITIRGSFRYGPGDYKLAVDLVASGSVSVNELITDKFEFEDAEMAFEAQKSGRAIKVLINGPQDDGGALLKRIKGGIAEEGREEMPAVSCCAAVAVS